MAEMILIHNPLLVHLLLLWISISLSGVVLSGGPEKTCSAKERNSLLQFKTKLFDPNGILSSWTEEDNCCRWKGVTCNESGVVVMLDLHNPNATDQYHFDLSGEIDSSLLSLQNLRHLDLSGNNFSTSSFPSFIGFFKELRYLNLSTTGLVGVIPSLFGNLTSLEFLDLSNNVELRLHNTEGLSFLTHMSSLRYIDMSGIFLYYASDLFQVLNSLPFISVIRLEKCAISSIPESLFPHVNFKNLTILALGQSVMIESKFPDWLFKIETLEYLDLGNTNSYTSSSLIIPVAIGKLYRLKFLDLSWNSLDGSIPDSIGNLSLLQEIYLHDNNLIGHIPEWLGGLSSLRRLDFSNNQLGGRIPESVGRILSLQQLVLSENILSGLIPTSIVKLSSLKELYLNNNELNGPIPSSLGRLKSLEILNLSKNRFNGSIPQSLCDLEFLNTLDFSWNDEISGSIPDCVWGLTRIKTMGFGGKGLQGVLSESHFSKLYRLNQLTVTTSKSMILNMSGGWTPPFSLSFLFMYSCKLGPEFPTWLRTQNELEGLTLEDVGLSEELPIWIWNFSSKIGSIEMPRNKMKGKLPDATYAPILQAINLDYNDFEGLNWLSDIWKMMPHMRYLSVAVNNFSGAIPSSLCSLDFIKLDFSINNFSGKIPRCLMTSPISYLNLASNNLSGDFPASINGSECSLWYLNMEGNSLTGILPEWLTNCKELVILKLGINKLTGNITTWVAESMPSSLRILDLSRNNLHGRVPASFRNFKAMQNRSITTVTVTIVFVEDGKLVEIPQTIQVRTSIDFSGNQLSGEIPEDIGSLLGLQSLSLSGNHLTGNIPETISRLKALEILDLSINNLSGEIPQSMSSMTTLSHLNLSFNNLSGEIPTGNQFSTFTDPSIFMGNPYLCGFPYRSCDNRRIPISSEEHKDKVEMLWVYLNMVLGFIVGFWLFYGTLIFKKTWRSSYFHVLQDFNEKVILWCKRVWKTN